MESWTNSCHTLEDVSVILWERAVTRIWNQSVEYGICVSYDNNKNRGSKHTIHHITELSHRTMTFRNLSQQQGRRRAAVVGGLCLIFAFPFLLSNRQSNNGVLRLTSNNAMEPTLDMHKPGVYQGTPWKTDRTVSTKVLGETPFARCDIHSVKSVDGSNVIRDWLFMEERDAINVAVYTADGKFLVFEQEKYAIHGKTLSPVGGFVDDGESPFDAARREVMEELGVGSKQTLTELQQIKNKDMINKKALYSQPLVLDENNEKDGSVPGREPDWVYLGKYRTAANRGGGFLFTYLLVDAVPVADGGGTAEYIRSGDAEPQTLVELSLDEMSNAVARAQFQEIKWTATLSLSLLHMQNRKAMQK